jgi:hypothetical protein
MSSSARHRVREASFPPKSSCDDWADRDGLTEEDESFRRRYETTARELEQRVSAEPRVAGVTLAEQLPLMPTRGAAIELDELDGAGPSESVTGRALFVSAAAVDPDFFDVFQTPVIAGRGFAPRDAAVGANTVVVNQLFVDKILAGRNAVGRRIVTKWMIRKRRWFQRTGAVV